MRVRVQLMSCIATVSGFARLTSRAGLERRLDDSESRLAAVALASRVAPLRPHARSLT